jgi:hypothetical protein
MKFNLFTFLKENKILVVVKTKLLNLFDKHKNTIKDKVNVYITEKSPTAKDKLVNFIVNNIELPFYLKPFKGLVKKTINKNFDKLVDFILTQINK